MTVTQEGFVAVITWDDGENRINLDSLGRLHAILDELETIEGPLALVWTGVGKFFSNGLDLARFGDNAEEFTLTLRALHRTVARLLLYPAYSVAALNGHTFAGGALLSCAVDYRIMREDRGFWCMNEAEIGLALDEKLGFRREGMFREHVLKRGLWLDVVRMGILEDEWRRLNAGS